MAQEKTLITQAERERLLKEKADLEKRIATLSEDVKDARSQGDLSENADYKFSREEKGKLSNRLKEIELILKNAEIVEANDENNIDKFITVEFLADNFVETYHLLGAVSADPLNNEISNESPLGKAIFKAKKGQRVTVLTEDNDRFEVKIIDIKLPKKETKKKNEK